MVMWFLLPPPHDATSLDRLENALLAMNLSQYANIAIMGDFNINWMEDHALLFQLKNFTSAHGLHQLINDPTHTMPNNRATLLDLVFTTNPSKVTNISVHDPFSTSDHSMISFCIRGSPRVMSRTLNLHYLYAKCNTAYT